MITPRQKAIIVGAMFGGAKINHYWDGTIDRPGQYYLNCSGLDPIVREWIYNNIPNNNLIDQDFLQRVHDKFVNFNFPLDYFEKMSPLALAIYRMASLPNETLEGGMPYSPFDYCKEVHEITTWEDCAKRVANTIWKNKWGINLKLGTGRIEHEDDLINLWLLLKQYILEIKPSLAPNSILSAYPRKHRMIYLSGGQQFAKDGGVNWRAKITPALYRMGYDVFNPAYEGMEVADRFGVNLAQLNMDEYIAAGRLFIEKDLEAIKASDAIITLIDASALRGAGTKSEATVAVDYNIPNYFVIDEAINPRDLPIWLAGCMRGQGFIFRDFDKAIFNLNHNMELVK